MPAHAHAQHLRKSIDPSVSTNMSPTKAENTDTKHRYRNTGREHRHRNHINIAYKPIQSLCQKAPSTIGFATLLIKILEILIKTMEIKVMDVVYQGARNPSACKKRHKILCAKGARNPAQAGKKIASPKAINYIKHCSKKS